MAKRSEPTAPAVPGRAADWAAPALLVVAASVLILANLGNGYLWQDEAQTALVARTVVSGGLPRGTDGVNFFSQELGAEYGPGHLWRWHTWLPFYLLAAFFAVAGEGTFVARLPFALCGVGAIALAWAFARSLWASRRAGIVAGVLLLGSVPFLILSRQCRYYSLAALLSLLALHAYLGLARRSKGAGALLVAALVLLFHTHYLYSAAAAAAILAHALLFERGRLRPTAGLLAVSVAFVLPWVLWLSGMQYRERYEESVLSLRQAGRLAPSFLSQLFEYVFPPLLLAVPIALVALRRFGRGDRGPLLARADASGVALLVFFLGANLAALSLSAPAPFFRYLAPLLPVCAVLMARIVEGAFAWHALAGAAVLAALVAHADLPIPGRGSEETAARRGGSERAAPPRPRLRDHLYEITHDFDGPIEGIVRHLEEHGRPGQTVAITYGDLPLKFYTKMRVVGGLTGEDLAPAREADWVIVRKHVVSDKDLRVREYLRRNVPWDRYQPIRIDYPDTPFENRESPQEHRFRTATDEDRVVIFRRVRP